MCGNNFTPNFNLNVSLISRIEVIKRGELDLILLKLNLF